MCTVVVSVAPDAKVPVLLAGVRDEFAGRPWEPPGRHWPKRPRLIGGRDLRAGGTWLAVDPVARRAAALLNGRGVPAGADRRRSRGHLPLAAAAEGDLLDADLSRYDPFHLVLADLAGVRLWHWDGVRLTADRLPPGTHMIVNSGWERGEDNQRVAYFRPRFAAAPRPDGVRAVPTAAAAAGTAGDPPSGLRLAGGHDRAEPAAYWGRWAELAAGDGLATDDPRALIVRHELPDGQLWGSSSVTLLALAEDGVRYDFSARPADPRAFRRVLP